MYFDKVWNFVYSALKQRKMMVSISRGNDVRHENDVRKTLISAPLVDVESTCLTDVDWTSNRRQNVCWVIELTLPPSPHSPCINVTTCLPAVHCPCQPACISPAPLLPAAAVFTSNLLLMERCWSIAVTEDVEATAASPANMSVIFAHFAAQWDSSLS